MRLLVYELTGENAITLDDGEKVYDRIHPEIVAGSRVELDFGGVNVFASPFFNAAVGQLFRDFSPQQLKELLCISGVGPKAMKVLEAVIRTAEQYYSDPEASRVIRQSLQDEALTS